MSRKGFAVAAVCGLLFVGCQQESHDYVAEFDAELAEMTGVKAPDSATTNPARASANALNFGDAAGATGTSAGRGNNVPPGETKPGQVLLQVGREYAFTRSLRQSLLQQIRGARQRSESNLELTFTLRVEATQAGRTLLSVQYSDVNYYHEIAGQRTSFDSSTPAAQIPAEALPYRGLVDNGFSFWLNANNQVQELYGFDQFLQRCVRYLPAGQQADVVQSMSVGSPAEKVALLVDETFGLLPLDGTGSRQLNVGDSWQHDRQLTDPVPMYLSSTCSLKSLQQGAAHVELAGRVSGSGQRRNGLVHGTNLNVKGGRTSGNCQIDQATGLPIRGRIERSLELDVAMSDGTNGRQLKEIVSSIQQVGAVATDVSPATENTPAAVYGN